ncbi:MAG: nucleotide exchange factor GrpE [Oscillospiraceae bacterium]|jgi:molecular chaperone GrpE|nr:nucleotide exchange factor GrpE [Oscillospiraceae bacterium]
MEEKQQPEQEIPAAQPQEELDPVVAELAKTKDQMLRLAAEYDNFRKRSQREREDAYQLTKAEVLKAILPVLDNFERAAAVQAATLEEYAKGVRMILDQLAEAVAAQGAEAFGAPGDPFEPACCHAVAHVENAELGENVIAEVFQKGWRVGGRVIREAMVSVAN